MSRQLRTKAITACSIRRPTINCAPLVPIDRFYAFTANLQLDFGGNIGLNKVTPRTQLFVGLSQRF
jgi:hypothetical protein